MRAFYIVVFCPKPKSDQNQLKFSLSMGLEHKTPGVPKDFFNKISLSANSFKI